MRVVVTGATGNLGGAVVDLLSRDGRVDSVVGLARRPPARAWPGAAFVSVDLRRDPLDPVLDGADAVVHCAWAFQPTHDPVATWENNVRGAERLIEATVRCGAGALVHVSSVGAYRANAGADPVDESWPTDALCTSAYGREKSYLERVLDHVACQHPLLRVVRVRPCFLFRRGAAAWQWRLFAGPWASPRTLRSPRPLVPLPDSLRLQVLHTEDAAAAVVHTLHEPVHGAFNLAGGPPMGPDELADALGGRALRVPYAAARAAVAAAWHMRLAPTSPHLLDLLMGLPVLDSSRAEEVLGWRPSHSPDTAVGELLEGLRSARRVAAPPEAQPTGPIG